MIDRRPVAVTSHVSDGLETPSPALGFAGLCMQSRNATGGVAKRAIGHRGGRQAPVLRFRPDRPIFDHSRDPSPRAAAPAR